MLLKANHRLLELGGIKFFQTSSHMFHTKYENTKVKIEKKNRLCLGSNIDMRMGTHTHR
jgi:hypothetical protein